MPVLVDTGVLLGAADADDADYLVTSQFLATSNEVLLVTVPVIAETSWQIERHLGVESEARFLESLIAGELTRVDLTDVDWRRAVDLVRQYSDLGLGLVDSSLVAVAERLNIETIATLNRRDFAVVRPAHCDAFQLVPSGGWHQICGPSR